MTMTSEPLTRLTLPSDWLTTEQIARLSQRHQQTVLRAMRSGQLRATQYGKNCSWRAHIDDVEAWMRGEAPQRRLRPVQRRS
jgi:excisionase family DNA binding protein